MGLSDDGNANFVQIYKNLFAVCGAFFFFSKRVHTFYILIISVC